MDGLDVKYTLFGWMKGMLFVTWQIFFANCLFVWNQHASSGGMESSEQKQTSEMDLTYIKWFH